MKKRNLTVMCAAVCAGLLGGILPGEEVKAEDKAKIVFAQDLDTDEKANKVMNEILTEYTEKQERKSSLSLFRLQITEPGL